MKKNKGIFITGGKIKADNIAVGKNSKIEQNQQSKKVGEKENVESENKELAKREDTDNRGKFVFISYNHKDKKIADKIKEILEGVNLIVKIDSESMFAGEDIKEFIDKSIAQTDVTLSIVSANSLMSSWVVLESMQTFLAQKVKQKQFVAGYIDSSFFSRDFVDNALDKIECESANLRETIRKRLDKNRNINDLQNDLERLIDLEHNLPKLVDRLKSSLSIDISGENFENGMKKIINSILSFKNPTPSI